MEWSEKVCAHYVTSAREITRKALKHNRILRVTVWIMAGVSAVALSLLFWRFYG